MVITGIYKIQSISHPERCYIGSAVNINNRWSGHKSKLRLGTHHSPQLQRHFNKYGVDDLQLSIVLSDCLKLDLKTIEDTFLKPLPFFNCNPIASRPPSRLG